MHVAFALMIAVPAMYVIRNRVIRAFFAVYPLLVTVTVVVTGNHWWLDAFLGALVAGVSALAASGALARARPDAWAFRTGPPRGARLSAIEPRTRTGERVVEMREVARNRLIESRLTPNAISMTGLVLNVVAAVLVFEEEFFLGGLAFIVGSIMDTLDGRYSRMSGKGTPFGAFLDSTLDRDRGGRRAHRGRRRLLRARATSSAVAAVVLTVLLSLMVSYTRARAEALGVECKVGLATRAVRVVILSAGLVFAKGAGLGDFELLAPAIYAMAVLTGFTVLQRVFHVRSALRSAPA